MNWAILLIGPVVTAGIVTWFLNLKLEATKSLLQKELHQINLYTTKKMETYEKLFELFRIAKDEVLNLSGMRYSSNFNLYDVSDAEDYMKKMNYSAGEIKELIALWNTDKSRGIQKLREYERDFNIHHARKCKEAASNHLLLKQIYIHEDVYDTALELNKALDLLLIMYLVPDNPRDDYENKKVLSEKVNNKFQEFIGMIVKQLTSEEE